MNRGAFARLEAECTKLVSASGATASGLRAAFAPLNTSLTPAEKVSAVLHFVARDGRQRRKNGSGDWLAWYFVHGAIPGAQRLPWTAETVRTMLDGVIDARQALPPEFVARAVEQLARQGPLDAATRKHVLRAARELWPPGSTEGTNFKKAAAKLRLLARG